MNIIIPMSLTSSILFLLFLAVDKLFPNLFTQRNRYRILKIALILQVIPLSYFKTLLAEKLNFTKNIGNNIFIDGSKPLIISSSNRYYFNNAVKFNLIIGIVWISVSLIILFKYLREYFISRTYVSKNAYETSSPNILDIQHNYQTKLHIKQKVRIYQTNEDITPFTIGILKPIIVVPNNINDSFALHASIFHELYHIKSKDGFILLLRILITKICWFNPLNLFLNSALSTACELACDEFVTKEFDTDKRKEYANLIIDLATHNTEKYSEMTVSISDSYKLIKKRVEVIMNKKKRITGAAVFLSAGLVLCSVLPTLAFDSSQKLNYDLNNDVDIFVPSSNEYIEYQSGTIEYDDSTNEDAIIYNNQFTDLNGNIYDADQPVEHANCSHSFSDGTFKTHAMASDGGCITSVYAAQRCSKCGYILVGSLISETKYTKCPH